MILKWAIAFVLFAGDVPIDRRLFLLDPDDTKTQAQCREAVVILEKEAAKQGLGVWAECIEINYKAPDPKKPTDKKSEVTS